eukprot:SAG11_NODE_184_length_13162_cov_9.151803_2_plen_188_part_00
MLHVDANTTFSSERWATAMTQAGLGMLALGGGRRTNAVKNIGRWIGVRRLYTKFGHRPSLHLSAFGPTNRNRKEASAVHKEYASERNEETATMPLGWEEGDCHSPNHSEQRVEIDPLGHTVGGDVVHPNEVAIPASPVGTSASPIHSVSEVRAALLMTGSRPDVEVELAIDDLLANTRQHLVELDRL